MKTNESRNKASSKLVEDDSFHEHPTHGGKQSEMEEKRQQLAHVCVEVVIGAQPRNLRRQQNSVSQNKCDHQIQMDHDSIVSKLSAYSCVRVNASVLVCDVCATTTVAAVVKRWYS